MFENRITRNVRRLCLGVVLAAWAQASVAAGWVTGQVTAINLDRNQIVINDRTMTLSAAVKLSEYNQLKAIKPGHGVRYEAEGTVIKRIEPVQLPPT
jgi:hypothetical protein